MIILGVVLYISWAEVRSTWKVQRAWSNCDECGQSIATLRTGGGEYLSKEFQEYLKLKGIRHELTIVHTPEQNSVWKDESNLDGVSKSDDCICWSVQWVWGRSSSNSSVPEKQDKIYSQRKDPWAIWKVVQKKARYQSFESVWLCGLCSYTRFWEEKAGQEGRKITFCCKNSKGYRLLDEKSWMILKRRDVTFNELNFDYSKVESGTVKHITVDMEPEISEQEEGPLREEPRHSERDCRPPNRTDMDSMSMLIQ